MAHAAAGTTLAVGDGASPTEAFTALAEITDVNISRPHPNFDLEHYFTHSISYKLDAPKRKALKTFLEAMNQKIQPSLEPSL